ncbi:S8 family serine peptidase [Rhizohabitans arisaemae]|uniref:S8 family serine peptidase n=1 Tax=Rhizohabitans arisaemae TaxID=2720610 RepID=UPI0024B1CD5B|nr:S8 family serine peptidase [Rhizohabitans arisaemae]
MNAVRRVLLAGTGATLALALGAQPVHAESINERLGLDFKAAHEITRGDGATLAILGGGVDTGVRVLRGKVERGEDFAGVGSPKYFYDTLFATLILGGDKAAPPLGLRGLAPDAKVLSVRVEAEARDFAGGQKDWDAWFNGQKLGPVYARAIRYAVDQGAGVILANWSWIDTDARLNDAIAYAVSKKTVIVTNMGRSESRPTEQLVYPSATPGVIGAAAIGADGRPPKDDLSARNSGVFIAAPDSRHSVVAPGDKDWLVWGSRVSAAQVAAAALLVKAKYPDMSAALVAQALATSTRRTPKGGYDFNVGFGIVNPVGALQKAADMAGYPGSATPGGAVVDPNARFVGDAPVHKINAVQRSTGRLVLFGGLVGLGAVLSGVATILLIRRRRVPS